MNSIRQWPDAATCPGTGFFYSVVRPHEHPNMTDEEFENFVSSAMDELTQKQEWLGTEYGLGTHARWWFDQESEKLEFFDKGDNKVLTASVIHLGSYSANSKTWKWAWANDSIVQSQREKAISLKALADLTGYSLFAKESPVGLEDESMAWELAAMSLRHLGGIGVYKAPSSSGTLASFLAITAVQRPSQ